TGPDLSRVTSLFSDSSGGITAPDAVRLSKQAAFGPTQTLVDHITSVDLDAWLTEQFALKTSTYADLASLAVPANYCNTRTGQDATNCTRDYFSNIPMAMRFYADAVGGQDQLRQRVAFALSQIVVASDVQVRTTAGLATFNQIFIDNAFGNYRDILRQVTLNPYMGDYLTMADSTKTAPNENYARELMQLFSVGVVQLNSDGTQVKDATGATIAPYTPTDVKEVAKALTGWTYARLGTAAITDNNSRNYSLPMIKVPARYETAAKTFLGKTVPANATQEASVDAVVDAVFGHANTAPFISKGLIQQLVTSNPSPAYVKRVATVFADNGAGVRGDLKAVVRAILTDAEARGPAKAGVNDGKVKEPVLLTTSLARLIGDKTDGYVFTTRDAALGQSPFRAPSVFNFYPPDFPLPLSDGLLSPASKLMTTATVIARHNLIYDWTVTGDQASRTEYNAQAVITGSTGTQPDWTSWEAFGTNTEGMLDRIDLLVFNKTMSAAQRDALRTAANAVTNATPAIQARKRAQVALYIATSSPQFQVDR
ncbi:MAG: DUF1800 domain-containing protein, partial [Caulobacteraceae bacterium]